MKTGKLLKSRHATKMEMLKAMYHNGTNEAKDLKANYGKIMSAMHQRGVMKMTKMKTCKR